ncbi:MAG: SufS family cysteine desulfurase [Bacteroidia bacterium]|nr:SufS family cysteine desulfurase [Bacteroidia bacterium]MDW8235248.1 SufS family cysteine desulfurase [Bacteroidia bacterium]
MKDLVQRAERLRADFPLLHQRHPSGSPLIYLDNAATTHKPRAVLQTLERFYTTTNANIHRGLHWLSQEATRLYEEAREVVAQFLQAASPQEIVFVKGTTEGINLIAHGLRQVHFQPGDELLLTAAEHHANIVPWHLIARDIPVRLRPAPLRSDGGLDWEAFQQQITPRTRLIAITAMSNALGTEMPVSAIGALARQRDIPFLVDAAQFAPHKPINVQEWCADFVVFSGHKLYGPTGIGVVYMRHPWGETLPPYQGGGDMIVEVRWDSSTYAKPPQKFEAGTPPIAEAIALAESIRYLTQKVGWDFIQAYEQYLTDYAQARIEEVPGLQLFGTARPKGAIWSFYSEAVHPHDMATFLDQAGIAARAGHHCAQPLMEALQVPATTRASLAFYNLPSEIDSLAQSLHQIVHFFV